MCGMYDLSYFFIKSTTTQPGQQCCAIASKCPTVGVWSLVDFDWWVNNRVHISNGSVWYEIGKRWLYWPTLCKSKRKLIQTRRVFLLCSRFRTAFQDLAGVTVSVLSRTFGVLKSGRSHTLNVISHLFVSAVAYQRWLARPYCFFVLEGRLFNLVRLWWYTCV